ncbi:hydroxyacylglutathione hydrolase [Elioraea tepidiphila]|jgi:hydroxyacylglutathione hydrolase|uniref:hydroxyacylglutathione hydrolase n=1 Tax=Elioraea tepidiphila TaxID=457934 RepID=UPI000370C958|nr:hydroxyacylglutathione hydrolase [Elioraea tepidiphila]
MARLEIVPVPALSDNYVWLLRDEATGTVAVVDPGEDGPVEAALAARGWEPALILLTHHHGDHVGGVAALKAAHGAAVIGAAADAHRLPALDRAVSPGDTVAVGESEAVVIDTPGHTRGHIAYHFPEAGVLACGDTLFSLGCGRMFEGSAEEFFAALTRLAALPDDTLVLCGHEYTQSNARFALTVEPDNAALRARAAEVEAQRAAGRPTVPVTLGAEKAANPFLHARDAAAFAALRAAKDSFR